MESFLNLKVIAIKHETPDSVTVYLQNINDEKIKYLSGQFLTLVFEINGKEIRRSFSLSSIPDIDNDLAITVKRIANGEISNYIYRHLAIGDVIQSLHPSGRFILSNTNYKRDVFMIAAGSGVTPLFSIIKTKLLQDSDSRIILIYSNRDELSTIFYDELNNLQNAYKENFICIYIFSEPENKNRMYKGHLSLELLRSLIELNLKYKKQDAIFMLCGPFDYMRNAEMIIIAMGFDKSQLKKENFVVIAEQEAINTAPVQEAGDKFVSIKYQGQNFDLTVPFGKPILKAALEQGIKLPYSCQGGICGN